MSGLELVIALLVVFVGATVMGTLGFGLGLVVAPVLLLFVEPQSAVVTVNGVIAVLVAVVVVRTRRHLELRSVWLMALGGVAAVPIGVFTLSTADPAALRIAIGLLILALGVLSLFNIQLPLVRRRFSGAVVGFVTSLFVTALSIGGPLAAIYAVSQGWPQQTVRTTLAFYFLLSYVAAFGFYAWSGLVDRETVANIGILVPALVAGLGLATFLVRQMNQRVFRYLVAAAIITSSVVLLSQQLAGL